MSEAPFITLSYPPSAGGQLSFDNADSFLEWLDNQVLAWAWVTELSKGTLATRDETARHTASTILTGPLRILYRAQEFLRHGRTNPNVLSEFSRIAANGTLPASASADFQLIESLRKDDPAIAIHALNALSGRRSELLGRIALGTHLLGITKKSVSAAQTAFDQANTANREAIRDIQATTGQARDLVEQVAASHKQAAATIATWERESREGWAQWHTKATEDTQTRLNELTQQHQQQIEKLEKAFREGMALRAPVDYWNDEAKTYRRKAWFAVGWCVAMAVLLPPGFYGAAWALDLLPAKDDIRTFVDYWHLLPGALAAFLYIWALRIGVRYIVASDHMAGMARQRATILKTYLSMLASENVQHDPQVFRALMSRIVEPIPSGLLGGAQPPPAPHVIFQNALDSTSE